jgi:hypothetical protein
MMPLLPIERRDAVREQYPWLLERDQAMVVGTDLDALISAAFMHHHFNWQPIGVYNLKEIYAADGASNDDLKRAIWVDLDIARSDIRSVGHHILTNRPGETISGLERLAKPTGWRKNTCDGCDNAPIRAFCKALLAPTSVGGCPQRHRACGNYRPQTDPSSKPPRRL